MSTPDHLASHQVLRASAAQLVIDRHHNVLILQTTYKMHWELPGGGVETGESPADAAEREALEELGLAIPPGRLLCVDYARPRNDRPTSMLHFVFQAPPAEHLDLAHIAHPPEEIVGYRLVPIHDALLLLGPRLGPRCARAHQAAINNTTVYLEDGLPERAWQQHGNTLPPRTSRAAYWYVPVSGSLPSDTQTCQRPGPSCLLAAQVVKSIGQHGL